MESWQLIHVKSPYRVHDLGHLSGCSETWSVHQWELRLVCVPSLTVLSLWKVKDTFSSKLISSCRTVTILTRYRRRAVLYMENISVSASYLIQHFSSILGTDKVHSVNGGSELLLVQLNTVSSLWEAVDGTKQVKMCQQDFDNFFVGNNKLTSEWCSY